jgi:hypothetical protein
VEERAGICGAILFYLPNISKPLLESKISYAISVSRTK